MDSTGLYVLGNSPDSRDSDRASWQLPRGVPKGAWDYTQADSIAREYDEYFQDHSLLALDQALLDKWIVEPGTVIDFGCGTGRALRSLLARRMRGIGIDLSQPMLNEAKASLSHFGDQFSPIRANLVELDCIASGSADYGICLFSTLGMIKGDQNRRAALSHMVRTLKPGGRFVLHVHNFWFNLYDPGGPWWLLKSLIGRAGQERGDRLYNYRGIRNFYLHAFTRRELKQIIKGCGLEIAEWVPLRPKCSGPLVYPWLLQSLRATGWIVLCKKPN
ncbi:MAG: class I SAM-dependent methyltransferase [Planctomycetales bacterium]|nr:class I SAM-dependent methyltransferase [Planctomycetales bacterium]